MHEQFGRYILLERIAIGGMAEIFQAKAPGLGGFEKILAIKRLHPRYSQDADFIEMLIDEARITVELSHSNIGQIFDLGKVDEHYYIAMEYIDGRDLYRVLKRLRDRGEQMPIDAAAYVAMEACAGLDYAHRKKDGRGRPLHIVHRDVSPQNVLLSFEGEVKIVDFGIAKAALRAYETEAGIIKGKFYYMSPEQARGEPLDHRTDIFSIGVVLYEMLTGELLYKDDDEVTLLSRVRRADIEPPSSLRPEIPPTLERIVMRALARDRGERFSSAQHMQRELARFLRTSEVAFNKARLGQLMSGVFYDELSGHVDAPLRDRHEMGPDARSVIAAARFDDGEDPTTLEPGLSGTGQLLTGSDLLVIGTGEVHLVDEPDTRGDVAPGLESLDDSVELLDSIEPLVEDDFFDDEPTRAYEGERLREEAEQLAAASGWAPPAQPVHSPAHSPVQSGAPRPSVAQPVHAQPVHAQPVHAQPAVSHRPSPGPQGYPASARPHPTSGQPAGYGYPPQTAQPAQPAYGQPAYGQPEPAFGAQPGYSNPYPQASSAPAPRAVPVPSARPVTSAAPQRRTGRGEGLGPTSAMQSAAGFSREPTRIVPGDQVTPPPGRRRRRRPTVAAPTIAASHERRWMTRERALIGAILLLVVVGTGAVTTMLLERQDPADDPQPTVVSTADPDPTPPEVTPPPPPTPSTATIVMSAKPANASVRIDEKWVVYDAAGSKYEVKAGEPVEVKVQAEGYVPYETTVTLLAGSERPIEVELERLRGTLVVETRPSGATVYVDDTDKGESPLTLNDIQLDTPTKLTVKKDGYLPIERTITWKPDGDRARTVELELEAKPAPAPPRRRVTRRTRRRPPAAAPTPSGTGFLSVTSRQWGSVFVDRAQVAMETPMIKYKVSAGRHRVHVCYSGDRSRCTPSKTVTIKPGETSVLKF